MPRIVFAGLVVVTMTALLSLVGSRHGRRRAMVEDEDCAVSECGADGVPLSKYAG